MRDILGLSGQFAAGARLHPWDPGQPEIAETVAVRWTQRNPAEYPFVRKVAAQLAARDAHDAHDQFMAGIDLILKGTGTAR
ncbi:TetR family transcriptional regulator [Burkholderia aenigmatica]|uniref:hypothetical protein n=1 Tax=Burkholderia cepacia complex TaxID=87882 RepID=UPI000F087500|nr:MULTISPECIES: hypothetical protein [Burkholderia cepacia complex]AYQ41273.1 hypothetical protein CVS37_25070 [Burkholderia lata]VWC66050.1 TetR family transcriptional regulator [Burkholderia aenigmatica]